MARLARVVVPGYWHHITQRGNRRLPTFFSDDDYEAYLALIGGKRFLERIESLLGRRIRKARPGPKPARGRSN